MVDQPGHPDHPASGDAETVSGAGLPETDSPSMSSMVGMKIGSCTLKRIIGSGGMGTVYEAQQEQPRRRVAVKMMKRGISSRSALRRFEFESQTLGRLQHPGIAQVYEAGTHDDGAGGVPYFIMEYIPNARTLIEYAQEKKLGTRERLVLFSKVCDAIQHGHLKGIVHRDIKPGNVLVDSNGQPKIIDFGVARSTDSDLAVTTLQTDVGQLVGTLQYMSPEQCAADPSDIDTRSDIYALGMVLYELLTGQLPYDVREAAIHEAIRMVQEEEPTRLSSINRHLRGDVETIALKALEKERERRYQSASELEMDIARYLVGDPIAARRPTVWYHLKRFSCRHKAAVIVGSSFLLLLVASTVISLVLMKDAMDWQVEALKMRDQAIQGQQEAVLQAETARRAQKKAEESETESRWNAYIGHLFAASAAAEREDFRGVYVRLQSAKEAMGIESPDDMPFEWQYLAALLDSTAFLLDSGTRRILSLQFVPGSSSLVASTLDRAGGFGLVGWNASDDWQKVQVDESIGLQERTLIPDVDWNREKTRILDALTGRTLSTVDELAISPTRITFDSAGTRMAAVDGKNLRVWDVQTGVELPSHLSGASAGANIALSSNGSMIAFEQQQLGQSGCWVEVRDVSTGDYIRGFGDADVPLTRRVSGMLRMAFSPDDRLLATIDHEGQVRILDMEQDGSGLDSETPVVSQWNMDMDAIGRPQFIRFSPDGEMLFIATLSNVIRGWDVASGEMIHDLKGQFERIRNMTIQADSSLMACSGYGSEVHVFDLMPERDLEELLSNSSNFYSAHSISADGRQLVCNSSGGDIAVWDLQSGEQVVDIPFDLSDPIEAICHDPSGRRFAVLTMQGEVLFYDLMTGLQIGALPPVEGTASPGGILFSGLVYSPDGSSLAVKRESGTVEVWNLETMALQFSIPCNVTEGFQFSPDGSMIAISCHSFELWDVATGTRLESDDLQAALQEVGLGTVFSFSPDGSHLVLDGFRNTVSIIAIPSMEIVATLPRHRGSISYITHLPGDRLATVDDAQIRLWDTEHYDEVLSIPADGIDINTLTFVPARASLMGTDRVDRMRFWDTRTSGQRSDDLKSARQDGKQLEPMVSSWVERADKDSELILAMYEQESDVRTPEEQAIMRNLILKQLAPSSSRLLRFLIPGM